MSLVSFGFKHGLPLEADLVFDVRFMPNPFYIDAMREKTGLDREVRDYVFSFRETEQFMEKLRDLLRFVLPLYREEGKTVLVAAIGCTGGRQKEVAKALPLQGPVRKPVVEQLPHHRFHVGRSGRTAASGGCGCCHSIPRPWPPPWRPSLRRI